MNYPKKISTRNFYWDCGGCEQRHPTKGKALKCLTVRTRIERRRAAFAERNERIYADYQECKNYSAVGKRFGLCYGRTREIVIKILRQKRYAAYLKERERISREVLNFSISARAMNDDELSIETWESVDWIYVSQCRVALTLEMSPEAFAIFGDSERHDDPHLRFMDAQSAGMKAINKASAFDNNNSFGFKVIRPDGAIDYLRGMVIGPVNVPGSESDFRYCDYTFGLNQAPVRTPPT